MKDYEEYQGISGIRGSRDAIRNALQIGLADDPEWMETIELRNQTSHRYDEEMVKEATKVIMEKFYPMMKKLREVMIEIKSKDNE